MKFENIDDCLHIGVDFNSLDNSGCLAVIRKNGEQFYVVNMLRDNEALEVYNKLIGKENDKPIVVSSDFIKKKYNNTTSKALERCNRYKKNNDLGE